MLDKLPLEIWTVLVVYLDPEDLLRVSHCTTMLHHHLTSDSIWAQVALQHWFAPLAQSKSDMPDYTYQMALGQLRRDRMTRQFVRQLSGCNGKPLTPLLRAQLEVGCSESRLSVPELVRIQRHSRGSVSWDEKRRCCWDRLDHLGEINTASLLIELHAMRRLSKQLPYLLSDRGDVDLSDQMLALNTLDPNYYDLLPYRRQFLQVTVESLELQSHEGEMHTVVDLAIAAVDEIRKQLRRHVVSVEADARPVRRHLSDQGMILRAYSGDASPHPFVFNVILREVLSELGVEVKTVTDVGIEVDNKFLMTYQMPEVVELSDPRAAVDRWPLHRAFEKFLCECLMAVTPNELPMVLDEGEVKHVFPSADGRSASTTSVCRLRSNQDIDVPCTIDQVAGTQCVSPDVIWWFGCMLSRWVSGHHDDYDDAMLLEELTGETWALWNIHGTGSTVNLGQAQAETSEDPGYFATETRTGMTVVVFGSYDLVEGRHDEGRPLGCIDQGGIIYVLMPAELERKSPSEEDLLGFAENDRLGAYFRRWDAASETFVH